MKTCIFKIQLMFDKKISRDIEIPENVTLYELAEVIIDAFGFNFDHCFGFFNKITNWGDVDSSKKYELFTDLIEEGQDLEPTGAGSVKKTKINQVWKTKGDKIMFIFDYGDDWRFIVTLKGFGDQKAKKKYPIISSIQGKAPEQYPDYDNGEDSREEGIGDVSGYFSEYINYHNKINWQNFEQRSEEFKNEGKKLFDKVTPLKKKKEIIFKLAHVGDLAAFNILKKYLKKPDNEIRIWAEVAIDECKAFLKSDILEEDQMSIAVGAGQASNRLRFYFVVSSLRDKILSSEQKKIISEQFKRVALGLNSKIEKIEFGKNHALVTALISMDVAPAEIVDKGIMDCNAKKKFIRFHYFILNTHKPSSKEINDYLKSL